ncbi:MAG: RNA degradosome polyphosphate kinase [Propionibacteriaceae bacterium]|nr:RNA degradosome polyphosphate kinase [Propionibacteriaceae bacterium]
MSTLSTLSADRYSDRELSWLAFNNRVLDLARDAERIPLLERVRFCAIFSSNLDEFFSVRVAGLKRRIETKVAVRTITGKRPSELHDEILELAHELIATQQQLVHQVLLPALDAAEIHLLRWEQLSAVEQSAMSRLFDERLYPVLIPLTVDPAHPFPLVSGLSLNIGLLLRNPETDQQRFARVKVPDIVARFQPLGNGRFVAVEEIIIHNLGQVFTGMHIETVTLFRVTRNEDIEVEEDDANNLLSALEAELASRRKGRTPVRLEVADTIAPQLLDLLMDEFDVGEKEVFRLSEPLDLSALADLHSLKREDLKYPGFLPKTHPHLARVETSNPADMFAALHRRDVLLQHPYDSFATSVQRFIEQAAADPAVLAIKQTLYRTSGDSPIVKALIDAAASGKQVLAVVEVKARFDEQANIDFARMLERHGVHVVYGVVGLKTHCKLCLVVRDEGDELRRYAHIGTGNYNPTTARTYEDFGLLSADLEITEDVARLFNHLSGLSQERGYRRMLVAPESVRTGIIGHIHHEIANKAAGLPARIRIKVNGLVDEAIIDALYEASAASVPVQLWVRGTCALRPGIPGLSENIQVVSIVGRFLEHSRLYWFEDAGRPTVGIGSSDLLHRNLDRRVEVIVMLTDPAKTQQIDELFNLAFHPGTVAWHLKDEQWREVSRDAAGKPLTDMQEYLIEATARRRYEPSENTLMLDIRPLLTELSSEQPGDQS